MHPTALAVIASRTRSPQREALCDTDPRTGSIIEVFYADRVLATSLGAGPGWYWWRRGRRPGQPCGPFTSSYRAYGDALSSRESESVKKRKTKVRAPSATFIAAQRAATSGLTCGPANVTTTAPNVVRVICRRTKARKKRSERRCERAGRGSPRPDRPARATPLEPLWNLLAGRAEPQSGSFSEFLLI
jgi:hypothetical protein